MRDLAGGSTSRSASILMTFIVATGLVVAACSGGSGSGSSGGSGASAAADQGGASPAAGGGSGGESSVSGSIASTGAYAATWTPQPGSGPGIVGVALVSDKGTFGNIQVLEDGSITFTSGAPELTAGSYHGTGANVTMTNSAPCAFTLDNDVTGGDQTLHLKGSVAITGGGFC